MFFSDHKSNFVKNLKYRDKVVNLKNKCYTFTSYKCILSTCSQCRSCTCGWFKYNLMHFGIVNTFKIALRYNNYFRKIINIPVNKAIPMRKQG